MGSRGAAKPARLGFLGVGWIGRHRMEAMLATGAVEAAAIGDPSPEMAAEAAELAPDAAVVESLDGHARARARRRGDRHAERAARRAIDPGAGGGAAVFCQKPLGRNAGEAQAVVEAARAADRLLGVDLSYRFTAGDAPHPRAGPRRGARARLRGRSRVPQRLRAGQAVVLRPRAVGRRLRDGSRASTSSISRCGRWTSRRWLARVSATAHRLGGRCRRDGATVEDFAVATFALAADAAVRLACSWRLHAGREAEIWRAFYGTEGGAALRNVGGSFYDFTAEQYRGTAQRDARQRRPTPGAAALPPTGRCGCGRGERFDPAAERLVAVADMLDRIYAAA